MTNISKERRDWAAVPGHPKIRRRESWGAIHNYTRARDVIEPATRIFIHISVTNPGNYRGNDAHAQAIERIGRARFGTSPSNTGISYNFGIMPNAALYEFQPVSRRGAHTVNDFGISTCTRSGAGCPGRGKSLTAPSRNLNVNARSFVLCQNVGDPVTDAQIDRLARAIVCSYRAGFITRTAAHNPHGHRCVSSKSCPGNRMWARMWDLHTKIHHYLDHGLTAEPEEEDMPINKDDVETIAGEDVWPGPQRNPAVIDGTNTHWQLKSHVRHTTNAVMYEIPELLMASNQMVDQTLDLVQAIAERELGHDVEDIKAHITAKHAEAAAQREAVLDRLDRMNTVIDQLVEGKLNAEQVAEAWRQIVHKATAPAE